MILTCRGQTRIVDLGLAKDVAEDSSLTQTGIMMGTVMYAAPEQVEDAKNVGTPADVYSLGATLLDLLTGEKAPFAGGFMEILAKKREHKAEPQGLEILERQDIAKLLQSMLLHNADARPTMRQVAEEFYRILRSYESDLPECLEEWPEEVRRLHRLNTPSLPEGERPMTSYYASARDMRKDLEEQYARSTTHAVFPPLSQSE